jgi:SAM-dependent methyltransferase
MGVNGTKDGRGADSPATKWSLPRGTPVIPAETPDRREGEHGGSGLWDQLAQLYGAGPSPFASLAQCTVDRAGLRSGETVLDLGCGNGLALVPAASAVAPALAVGVDFSEEMLAAASGRVRHAGLCNVNLSRMDVRSLSFPDESFDAAVASSVLQFVGCSVEVLREWRRVLRTNGRLVFSVPRPAGGLELPSDLIAEFLPRLPPDVRQRLVPVPPPRVPDLGALCRIASFRHASVFPERLPFTVPSREAWWRLQWTHGIRALLEQFDANALADLKGAVFDRLESRCFPSGELDCEAEFSVVVAGT